jgi:quinol monooxygenase YgiN
VSSQRWSPIVELRQYRLRPGRRDELIDLFDRELVETQEEVGMKVIGQFRDLDKPDKFVWLRGFPDMQARAQSLAAFYGGPVWRAHREAANATMIDSDDVLLLRPARPGSGFALDRERVLRGGFVVATVTPFDNGIVSQFEQEVTPTVAEDGGSILGYFVTERSKNTFPSLPVREGEQVFVWFAGVDDHDGLERVVARHADRAQVLRLAPTSRSLLNGGGPGS